MWVHVCYVCWFFVYVCAWNVQIHSRDLSLGNSYGNELPKVWTPSSNSAYLPQEEDTIRLDLEELAKEASNYSKQLEAVELAIEQAKETLSKLQEGAAKTKASKL